MLALEHDVLFELRVLDLIVLNQHIFPNDLNGVQFLVFCVLRQKNLAEGSFAQHHHDFEISKLSRASICLLFFLVLMDKNRAPCIRKNPVLEILIEMVIVKSHVTSFYAPLNCYTLSVVVSSRAIQRHICGVIIYLIINLRRARFVLSLRLHFLVP